MANPFVKAWKYLMALFGAKVDEYADPKIQIQQAIEEAQRRHQGLTQQAAQVIGNQRQLEMRLNRQLADIEKLQANVRQALTLADQATAAGDAAKATEYNNAAEAFATQLVTAEQSVEDLKVQHDAALQAAQQAKKARRAERHDLQQKVAERTKLLEPAGAGQDAGEGRRVAAVDERDRRARHHAQPRRGPREDRAAATPTPWARPSWPQNSVQGRMMEVQQAGVQMAGHSRLEQIRASMRGDALPSGGARPRRPLPRSTSEPEQPLGQ